MSRMQASSTRLRQIADDPGAQDFEEITAPAAPPAASDAQRKIIGAALQMALRTLSQKTIVALANLFSLLLAGSAFWLWWVVLPSPTVPQLIGLGMYGCFVLSLHLVRKR